MIFNMIAMGASSGGGGLDNTNALIIATVPAGSTVRAENDGLIKTPTMWIADADSTLEKAVFQIPPIQFNQSIPWTVTASSGTSTASSPVLITTNREYEITLEYERVLFYNGVTDSELSSFDAVAGATIGTELTTTYNESTGNYWVSTDQLVIPSNYSQLNFEAKASLLYSTTTPNAFGLMTAKPVVGRYDSQMPKFAVYGTLTTTSSSYSVITINISQYAGMSYYIGMLSISTSDTRKIWLSK